jgi:hypothetical protein
MFASALVFRHSILTGWSRILADFQPIYITPVDGFAR